MLHSARSLVVACLLFAGACQVVHSREPIGARPHAVQAEDWKGTWVLGSGGEATIQVLDADQGLLEIAVVFDEDSEPETHVVRCQLLESGKAVFANIQDPERRHLYLWARVWRDDEQLIVWVAHGERVAAAMTEGRLPGVDKGNGNAILDPLTDEQLEQLLSYEAFLMHWDKPLAMIRIAG